MRSRNIVVIGASAGGIEALGEVAANLPSDFQGSICLVQHLAASTNSQFDRVLKRRMSLPVEIAVDRNRIQPGTFYVAPPDQHLLIDGEQMFLSRGPRENRVRPAVDPLFRSAALARGERAVGVILSGSLDDGTSGLLSIQKAGGVTIVQEPSTALAPDMPQSALDSVDVDHCLPPDEIGSLLGRLTSESVEASSKFKPDEQETAWLKQEVGILMKERSDIATASGLGDLVPASCPECGGPLWEVKDDVKRFRCHTGHAYTARHLAAGLKEAEEQALWVALRVMEERVRMLRRLSSSDIAKGKNRSAGSFTQRAEEAQEHVDRLRDLLSDPARLAAS